MSKLYIYIYPTPPHVKNARLDTRSIFMCNLTSLNSEFIEILLVHAFKLTGVGGNKQKQLFCIL